MEFINLIKPYFLFFVFSVCFHNVSSSQDTENTRSLLDHLKEIEATNSINFIYEHDILNKYTIHKGLPIEGSIDDQIETALLKTLISFKKVTGNTFALFERQEVNFIGTVTDKNGSPLVGATISIKNHNIGTASNLNGNYKLLLERGEWDVEVSYVGYAKLNKIIQANESPKVVENFILEDLKPLDKILVVGLKLRGVSLLENTSGAEVIDASRIPFSSNSELGQLLQTSVPSFHSTHQSISDGTDHIDPATLRGLGSDQVLILINGKRRHHSSLVNINGTVGRGSVSTDLNAIPIASIERIEVLRDGAATQYGSDAIAGVINIILKDKTGFIDINGLIGASSYGDGQSYMLNGNYGLSLGKKGSFLNLTLGFHRRGSLDRSGNYSGKIFGDNRDHDPIERKMFFDQVALKENHVMSVGQAESTSSGLFLNFNMPLASGYNLYAVAGVNYKIGTSGGFYRFPYQKLKQSGIHKLGFLPKIKADIFDQSVLFGIKGKLNDWNLDFSNSFGMNSFVFNVNNSNNASMGLSSPSSATSGGFGYAQNVINLDIQKVLENSFISNIGFGVESRIENYSIESGDRESWDYYGETNENDIPKEAGFQVFPGFRPENEVNQFRLNFGFYGEVETKITNKLLLNTASRFEFYEDFGNNLSWKLSGSYKVNSHTFIRSNFNTGFRAPSLPQVYFSSTAFQFLSQGQEQVGSFVSHFNSVSPTTRDFGIAPLSAETSLNYSLGISSNFMNNLSLTADAYYISIKDRIVATGRFSAENDSSFEGILGPINVSKAQFFANAVDTKTQGVDLSLVYNWQFDKSELNFTCSGNWTGTKVVEDENGEKAIKTSPFLDKFKNVLFNREEISRIEVAQPKSKVLLNVIYKQKEFEGYIGLTWYGTVKYVHPDDGNPANWVMNELTGKIESRDQLFSPKCLTDVHLKYNFSNQVNLILGATNIFNVFPDKHTHSANISQGIFKYSRRVSQFGLKGAYGFLKIGLRF